VATDFGDGTLSPAGEPLVVKEWRRGEPLSAATEVLRARPGDENVWAFRDLDDVRERDFVVRMTGFDSADSYLRTSDGALHLIDTPQDAVQAMFDDWMVVKLSSPWEVGGETHPADSLLAIRVDEFLSGGRGFTRLFTADEHTTVKQFLWTRNHLLLVTTTDVADDLRALTPTPSGPWRDRSLGVVPRTAPRRSPTPTPRGTTPTSW